MKITKNTHGFISLLKKRIILTSLSSILILGSLSFFASAATGDVFNVNSVDSTSTTQSVSNASTKDSSPDLSLWDNISTYVYCGFTSFFNTSGKCSATEVIANKIADKIAAKVVNQYPVNNNQSLNNQVSLLQSEIEKIKSQPSSQTDSSSNYSSGSGSVYGGARGPVGPMGPQGPSGPAGKDGASGGGYSIGASGTNYGYVPVSSGGGSGATGATGAAGRDGAFSFSASTTATSTLYSFYSLVTNSTSTIVVPNQGSGLIGQTTSNQTTGNTWLGYQAGESSSVVNTSIFLGQQVGIGSNHIDTSNFIGSLAGNSATNTLNVTFIGKESGKDSHHDTNSNFIGSSAGANALNINDSNLIGTQSGLGLTNSSYSNFIGHGSGEGSNIINGSSFLGTNAGNYMSNVGNSTFIGNSTGGAYDEPQYQYYNGPNEIDGIFPVYTDGSGSFVLAYTEQDGTLVDATTVGDPNVDPSPISDDFYPYVVRTTNSSNVSNSYVLGNNSLQAASSISNSNIFGENSGGVYSYGTLSNYNDFENAYGYKYTNDLTATNILGNNAGQGIQKIFDSSFIGSMVGNGAYNVHSSNFIGINAGQSASTTYSSSFIGEASGVGSVNIQDSNFFGNGAGSASLNMFNSNFIGTGAGSNVIQSSILLDSNNQPIFNSNFIGFNAGRSASDSSYSNFIGDQAGNGATSSQKSNFLGFQAGLGAKGSHDSEFIGTYAGLQASGSYDSVFIGNRAAGTSQAISTPVTGSFGSVFIGREAGRGAFSSTYSNFLGYESGYDTSSSSYSNLIGYKAGMTFPYIANNVNYLNKIGDNNIIIGTNISLPLTNNSNAINIGGVIFGSGTNFDTSGSPIVKPASNGKIGIGVNNPGYTLDVFHTYDSGVAGYDSVNDPIIAQFSITDLNDDPSVAMNNGDPLNCVISPTVSGGFSCSSDIRLKKNITKISDNTPFILSAVSIVSTSSLERLNSLDSVMYNWKSENDSRAKHAGFIAQQVEQIFPDLVLTNASSGLKSVAYSGFVPYLAQGIKELNTKVDNLPFANVGSSTLVNNSLQASLNDLSLFISSATDQTIISKNLANLHDMFSSSSLSAIKSLTNSLTLSNYDLSLNGNAITNVKAIQGMSGNWSINQDGLITAKIFRGNGLELKDADGNWYCYISQNGNLVKSGVAPCPENPSQVGVFTSAINGVSNPSTNLVLDNSVGSSTPVGTAATSTTPSTDNSSSTPIVVPVPAVDNSSTSLPVSDPIVPPVSSSTATQ